MVIILTDIHAYVGTRLIYSSIRSSQSSTGPQVCMYLRSYIYITLLMYTYYIHSYMRTYIHTFILSRWYSAYISFMYAHMHVIYCILTNMCLVYTNILWFRPQGAIGLHPVSRRERSAVGYPQPLTGRAVSLLRSPYTG